MNTTGCNIEELVRENMAEGMLQIDGRGNIRYANAYALQLLGMDRERVVGRKLGLLFLDSAENDAFVQLIIDAFLHPEELQKGTVPLRTEGGLRCVKAVAQAELAMDAQTEHVFVTTVCFQDVTEYVRKEKLEDQIRELNRLNRALEVRNQLIRKIFGCFILHKKDAQELLDGGRLQELNRGIHRRVTVTQSDLRGFTAMSYHLQTEDMLTVMNYYISEMSRVILAHHGVIIGVYGDGIIAVYGALGEFETQHEDAAAAAVEMQMQMPKINAWIADHHYDTYLRMGVGIDSGEAILGFVGNREYRSLDAMGEVVETADKIQSNTVEGDVLISEEVKSHIKVPLSLGKALAVSLDSSGEKTTVYQVKGIGAPYDLQCPVIRSERIRLKRPAEIQFYRIDGKARKNAALVGTITEISDQDMCICCRENLDLLTNVVMEIGESLYGKVTEKEEDNYVISFTSSADGFKKWKESLL